MPSYDIKEITDKRIKPLLDQIDKICEEEDITYFFAAGNSSTDKGPGYLSSYRHERTEGKLLFPFIKLIGAAVQNRVLHRLLCKILQAVEDGLGEEVYLEVIRIIEEKGRQQ